MIMEVINLQMSLLLPVQSNLKKSVAHLGCCTSKCRKQLEKQKNWHHQYVDDYPEDKKEKEKTFNVQMLM